MHVEVRGALTLGGCRRQLDKSRREGERAGVLFMMLRHTNKITELGLFWCFPFAAFYN